MADIKSPEERSKNMASIRSKDTKPEIWLRKKLFARGYRYRKNVNYVPGHPDAWLAKYNTAVFVNGCFWHRHQGCKYAYTPKSKIEFWTTKFQKNISRDSEVEQTLAADKIKILIVWECTVKHMMRDENYSVEMMDKMDAFFSNDEIRLEL